MDNMGKNFAASYQKVQANTASPAQRVVLVFKGICRHLETAVAAFERPDDPQRFEQINNSIMLAEQLIMELQIALDRERGGELAQNLDRIYSFWRSHLSEGNVQKDKKKVAEILALVKDMTEGWIEAERIVRTSSGNQATQPPKQ